MEPIVLKGRIEFTEEENFEYNRDFTATLRESAAFEYGNKTAVDIEFGPMVNGRTPSPVLLDTRYDKTIKRNADDFRFWLRKYFRDNYADNIVIIY